MKQRAIVDKIYIENAIKYLEVGLDDRLRQHGTFSFIGPHEIMGVLDEEVNKELLDAVHANDEQQVLNELLDIAIGAIFGIASIQANKDQNV